METTYSHTKEEAQVVKISNEGKTSRKALIAFISGASIVFAIAIYYCATTNHVSQSVILGVALGVIYTFAASVYKSFK
jgi:uncharacterized membrane protein